MSKLTDFELHALYTKAFSDKSAEGIVTACVAALRAIEAAATEPLLQRIAELERQLEEARKDAGRLDWLVLNPVETLDLFGRVTGDFSNWPKWIRTDIDAAMQKGQS